MKNLSVERGSSSISASVPSMEVNRMLNLSSNNKVNNFHFNQAIHGRSTSQVSLAKILNTICSFPPPDDDLLNETFSSHSSNVSDDREKKQSDCKLFGFDLNLPLGCSPLPPPSSEWNTLAAVDNSSVVDCDPSRAEQSRREDVSETEKSEICTDQETPPSDKQKVFVTREGEGCLELLVEAAKLISGGFEDEIQTVPSTKAISESESRKKKGSMKMQDDSIVGEKRPRDSENVTATATAETKVSRSRSGRRQVIPRKYRDSGF